MSLAKYNIWPKLNDIELPMLFIGGSEDVMHKPDNLKKMVNILKNATYLDMETNTRIHTAEMVVAVRKYLAKLNKQK